jgi:xanthine/uracil permease
MAQVVMLKHPKTGILKKGFFGFSWTTLFWGGFPAIFRGDLLMGLLLIILQWFTFGIATLIWAFVYNKNYTNKLIEQGYEFADAAPLVARARAKLGIAEPTTSVATV